MPHVATLDAGRRVVIIGASLAGATAAATLRKDGFDGSVTLVGKEPHEPYERPPLSKAYLRGEATFDDLRVRPAGFWESRGVVLQLGAAARSIDIERRTVHLSTAEELPYDRLLIATGCRNRPVYLPGAELKGVHTIRTIDDSDGLRVDLRPGARVVVGGMSFIGSEVAASLRQLDCEVTALVSGAFPLVKVIGEPLGRAIARIHESHGVRLVPDDRVVAVAGDGRAEAVLSEKGERLACDVVVLALGVEPETDVLEGTGIEVDRGVVVDERCRTNVDGVFACGDVARFFHPAFERRLRVEHWQNARRQGRAAARSMLGSEVGFDDVPWFWSEQFDHEVQYAGSCEHPDEVDVDNDGMVWSCTSGGRLEAVVALDRPAAVRDAIPIIAGRRSIDPPIADR